MHHPRYSRHKHNAQIASWQETKDELGQTADSLLGGFGVYVVAMGILVAMIKVVIPLLSFLSNIYRNNE